MHDFCFKRGKLYCENVSVASLAKKHGSPLFIYSHATLTKNFQQFDDALSPLDHSIHFAVKANSNLGVLRTLANAGSGFDIVSGGELQRVIAAGANPSKCVFAGVGKTEEEIELALKKGIYAFTTESEPEMVRINKIACRLKKKAPIAIRVNPNVDAKTHAKITTGTYENKFGIAFEEIEGVYERAAKLKNLYLRGVQMHIGSQLTEAGPFEKAVRKVAPLAKHLAEKHGIEFFSLGGGVGITYESALESGDAKWWRSPKRRNLLTPAKYAAKLVPLLKPLGLRILIEPGRFIAGNAGILVTQVEHVKQTGMKNFVIVDAAMNDLASPAVDDAQIDIDTGRLGRDAGTVFVVHRDLAHDIVAIVAALKGHQLNSWPRFLLVNCAVQKLDGARTGRGRLLHVQYHCRSLRIDPIAVDEADQQVADR